MTAVEQSFEAQVWVREHVQGAEGLTADTWRAVSGFTVLWNIFEAKKCGREASIRQIEKSAGSLGEGFVFPAELVESRDYWTDRYIDNGKTNSRFDALKLDHRVDRKTFVKDILLNPASPPLETFTALLLIAYRLRNNLFHGEKEIPSLNEQIGNLEHACRVLATAILLLPSSD